MTTVSWSLFVLFWDNSLGLSSSISFRIIVRTLFEEIYRSVIGDTNWNCLVLSSIDSNSSTSETCKSDLEINSRAFFGNSNNFIRLQTYAGLLDSLRESYEMPSQSKSVTYFFIACASSIGSSVWLCMFSIKEILNASLLSISSIWYGIFSTF